MKMGDNNELLKLLREVQGEVQSSNKKLDKMDKDIIDLNVTNEKLSNEIKDYKVKYQQIQKTNKILEQKVDICEQKLNFILYKGSKNRIMKT